MSRNQRLVMLGLAAVVVIVAVVAVPGADDDAKTEPVSQTTPNKQSAARPSTAASTAPDAQPPLLEAGRERRLAFRTGDTVRFRVRSSSDDEVHVHGYDTSKAVPAGKIVTLSFEADLEGIFEVELETSGALLGTIKVEPR